MSQTIGAWEMGSACLGGYGNVVSWRRNKEAASKNYAYYPLVCIQQCADASDGVFAPAASVTIAGKDALVELRNAINEALKYLEESKEVQS